MPSNSKEAAQDSHDSICSRTRPRYAIELCAPGGVASTYALLRYPRRPCQQEVLAEVVHRVRIGVLELYLVRAREGEKQMICAARHQRGLAVCSLCTDHFYRVSNLPVSGWWSSRVHAVLTVLCSTFWTSTDSPSASASPAGCSGRPWMGYPSTLTAHADVSSSQI